MLRIILIRIRRVWQNAAAVSVLILAPLLLILVLGAGFYEKFSPRHETGTIRLAWLPGNNILHNGFEVMLTQVPKEVLEVEKVYFRSEGLKLLDRGRIDCFVEIPDDSNIIIYRDPSSALHAAELESILESFLDYFKLNSIAGRTGFSLDYYPADISTATFEQIGRSRSARSLEFFSWLILCAALFAGAVFSASGFGHDRKNGILQRFCDTGYSGFPLWLGSALSSLLTVFIQLALIFSALVYIMHIYLGSGALKIIFTLAAASFFMAAAASAVFTLIRNIKTAWLGAAACFLVFYLPAAGAIVFPDIQLLGTAQYFSPLWWVLKSLNESAYSRDIFFFSGSIIISMSAALCLHTASALIYTKRRPL